MWSVDWLLRKFGFSNHTWSNLSFLLICFNQISRLFSAVWLQLSLVLNNMRIFRFCYPHGDDNWNSTHPLILALQYGCRRSFSWTHNHAQADKHTPTHTHKHRRGVYGTKYFYFNSSRNRWLVPLCVGNRSVFIRSSCRGRSTAGGDDCGRTAAQLLLFSGHASPAAWLGSCHLCTPSQ